MYVIKTFVAGSLSAPMILLPGLSPVTYELLILTRNVVSAMYTLLRQIYINANVTTWLHINTSTSLKYRLGLHVDDVAGRSSASWV